MYSQLVCTVRIIELLLRLQYFMRHNIVTLHLQSCIREHSTYNYVGTSINFSITEYVLYSCAFLNFIIQTIAPRQTA